MTNFVPCSCSKDYPPKDREYGREGGASGGMDVSTMKQKPVCLYVQTCIFPCHLCTAASIFYGHGCKPLPLLVLLLLHSKEIANVSQQPSLVEKKRRLVNNDFLLSLSRRKGKIFYISAAIRMRGHEFFFLINRLIFIFPFFF